MGRVVTLLALSLATLASQCGPPKPKPVEPDDTPNCAVACQHLLELGCEEGQPLEDGTTCTEFCEATQKAGHALNPTCVMTIERCVDLEPECLEK